MELEALNDHIKAVEAQRDLFLKKYEEYRDKVTKIVRESLQTYSMGQKYRNIVEIIDA